MGGIVLWGLMIWGSQKFARYYQARKESDTDEINDDSRSKNEADKCAA